jgi:hypothetical protein
MFICSHQLEYLGHVIGPDVVSTDTSKVEVVKKWPSPTNIKILKGFLDITQYYSEYVQRYVIISL